MKWFFNKIEGAAERMGGGYIGWGIVAVVCALGLGLMALAVWVAVELAGLMAQRTGIREGFWVLLMAATQLFRTKEGKLIFPPLLGQAVSLVYTTNALLLLWPTRPLLFWVVFAGVVVRLGGWVMRMVRPAPRRRRIA